MKSLSDTSTFYGESEASLVAFLADTLIPRTDTPGAIDAVVPQLMDQLYREWASVSTQRLHRRQLQSIAQKLADYGGSSSVRDASSRRVQALRELDAAAFSNGASASELADYRAVKSLIIDSYYSTESGATLEHHYVPIPGRWIASAPLSEIRKLSP